MNLFFIVLGGIFLITSAQTFNECNGTCTPWFSCNSLIEMRRNLTDPKNMGKIRQSYESELTALQCDYNRNIRTPYFCCKDKKEKIKIDYTYLRRHENRQLFQDGDCGHGNLNPSKDEDFYQADTFEAPWIAFIKLQDRLISSGTLINNRYVLTSARYAKRLAKVIQYLKVVLGDHDLSKNPDCQTMRNEKSECRTTQVVGVEEIHLHPNFSETDLINNIALLRLNKEIEFSINIQAVCLPFTEILSPLNNRSNVYGHGISLNHGSETNITTKNSVYIVDRYECEVLYTRSNSSRKIDDYVVCVKPKEVPTVCVPDDGGALSQNSGNVHYQMAVASFSDDVCSLQLPFVYTKIIYYLKWILETVTD